MSQTARMLDDTVNRLLERRLSDRDKAHLSETVRKEMSEAGLHLVLVTEENGGLGCTLAEAAVLAWRCGWHAAPIPIVEMLLLPTLDRLLKHEESGPRPLSGIRTSRPRDFVEWPASLLQRAMLLTTAEMTGAMARVLEIAVEHANTRSQFGRPLSKFQVIQHRLAEAASELAVTEAALAAALESEASSHEGELLRLAAKAQAGTAATTIAAAAHQVLGAIGYTKEHELHLFTCRLWQWRDEWGRQADCEREIGRAACAAPDGIWAYITGTGNERGSAAA